MRPATFTALSTTYMRLSVYLHSLQYNHISYPVNGVSDPQTIKPYYTERVVYSGL